MGCQLASYFGQFLETVDEVVLVAPDPKARPAARDSEEIAADVVSAFEEAQALWGGAVATVDGVELIEAVDGGIVTTSGVTVDLSTGGEIDVHERLWSATHL